MGYVAITEQVLLINQDLVLENTLDLLSQSLRETEDQLIREHQVNNSAFVNATGANGDNPGYLTRYDVDIVIKGLRTANAKFIMDSISGEDKFGTGPIRNSYWAKSSTDMIGNLEQVTGFTAAAAYPNTENLIEAEWGAISNLRFILSSVWPVTLNASQLGNNVENILCQGQEFCSTIDLDGYSAQYRYTPPRIAGGPLWLYGTSGYVFAQVPQITNFTWGTNLRCTLQ